MVRLSETQTDHLILRTFDMSEMTPTRVAIAGLGTVGSGVAKVLEQHQQEASEASLTQPRLVRILERNPNAPHAQPWYAQKPELFSNDLNDLLRDDVDVIVETIGGCDFARTLITEALKAGKHVVTANKDLIAQHGPELTALAHEQGRHLLFEAAVAGAIPVLRLLKDYFQVQDLLELKGILNGTTNYILSEMESQQLSFATALSQAQELGFAEQDPTNDIKGFDARYKLVILTHLITGQWLAPEDITLEGIDHLDTADFEYASRLDRRIKLVAVLQRTDESLRAYVLPLMIPKEELLAKISGSTNVVTLHGRFSEEISLIGKGAGSLPTASAIVADLNRVQHPRHHRPVASGIPALPLAAFDQYRFQHTLRFEVRDRPGIVGHIGQVFAKHGINIYALEQLPHYQDYQSKQAIFTLTLESVQEGLVQKALAEIQTADFMMAPVVILREPVPEKKGVSA